MTAVFTEIFSYQIVSVRERLHLRFSSAYDCCDAHRFWSTILKKIRDDTAAGVDNCSNFSNVELFCDLVLA